MWLNDKPPARFEINRPESEQQDSAEFFDVLGTAIQRETVIGSAASQVKSLPDYKETGYAPYLDLTEEEKLDPILANKARYADSIEELNAARTQLANERYRTKKIQDAGAMGIGAVVASQFVEPINLIPIGGQLYKTYRNGESILKAGITTAFATAGVVTAQEALLQQTQIARTYGESATNVTAAGFLGGVLGIGAGAVRNTFSNAQLKEFEAVMNPEGRMAEGKNPNLSDEVNAELKSQNLSAMAVDDLGDAEIKGSAVKKIVSLMGLDPQGRIMVSGSKAGKKAMLMMSDFALAVDKQVGMSVEKLIKNYDGFYYKAVSKYDQAFSDFVKRESAGKATAQLKGKLLGRRDFAIAVGKAMREGSDDDIIQKAADAWRAEVYDPLLKKAIEQKLLPEDLMSLNAKDQMQYLNRVYNKEAIQQNRGEFERMVKQYLDEQNVIKTQSQDRIRELSKGFDELEDTAKTQRLAEIETELANMPSKIANEVRSALKQRGNKSATVKTKAIQKAVEKVLAQQYDEVSTEALASEIATRIVATNDFRPMYDFRIRDTSNMPSDKADLASPFQKRAFLIPDNFTSASGTRFDQFLESDIELLAQIQIKRMAPDIEMTRVFGSVDLNEELSQIAKEFDGRIKEAADSGNKKLASKLERKKDRTLKDVEGIRDRLRNRYAQPDPNHFAVRIGRVFRDWNYLRMMGGVVPSSVPDSARIIASVGLMRAFGSGFRPLVKGLSKQSFSAQAKEEMGRFGIAVEALWNRNAMIHDISDITRGTSKLERGTSWAANKFSNLNFMNQWNQTMKMAHALSFQTKLMDELMAGKVPKELERLGISKDNAMAIREQMLSKAQKEDGIWVSNADLWENQDLRQMWVGALRQENDRVIVTPGQEKPLFMSTEFGKTLLQFRSFMTSATYRIFLAGLQGQDAHYMQGIAGMVSLGAMTYAFKEWNAGREVSDDPMVWLVEGIDRSGMLGVLMEVNNTSEKLTGNRIGLRGLAGVAEPASRYASRSALDSMIGPSFGLLGDTLKVFSAATGEYEWVESDTRAVQRLIPGQNLFYLRQQLDKIIQTED